MREILSALALGAILVPMFLYDVNTAFPGLAAAPPVLGTTLLILIGATESSAVHRMLGSRMVVAVGLISYSLYLWHWPLLAFLRVGIADPVLPPMLAAVAVGLSVVMAYVSWRFVERPFRIRPGVNLETGKTIGLSCGAIAHFSIGGSAILAATSGAILLGNGWPARIPPDVLVIEAAAHPSDYHRDCRQRYDLDNVCRLGAASDPGSPVDLLLIGDSHAASVADAVNVAARDAGLSGAFIGDVGCVPLLGVVASSLGNAQECRAMMEAAIRFANQNPELRYVVLVSRWPVNVEGTYMPTEPGERGSVRVLLAGPEISTGRQSLGTNAEIVSAGLAHTLDALGESGARILLLGPVPEIGWNVPDHLIANRRWGAPMPADPVLASVLERQAWTIDILKSASASHANTTYIPVAPVICTPECPTHDGVTVWYWDDDHLSPEGAVRWIAPLLTPHLTAR